MLLFSVIIILAFFLANYVLPKNFTDTTLISPLFILGIIGMSIMMELVIINKSLFFLSI